MTSVTCQIEDGIAQVRLNRPAKHNGLDESVFTALIATARRLRADRTVRGVLLAGAGPSFCAGLDFAGISLRPRDIAPRFIPNPVRGTNYFQDACWAWRRIPVPVAAAVHGNCLGGGLQLALAADFRFTTADARWSVMETRWGLIPDMTGVRTLAQLLGIDVVKKLIMTAEIVDGVEATRLGLATETAADPIAAARDLLGRIAGRSPDAIATGKRLVDRSWPGRDRRTFARERAAQLRLLLGANFAIARQAGRSGDPPRFRPRRGPA